MNHFCVFVCEASCTSCMQLLSDQLRSEDTTLSLSLSEPKEAVGSISEQADDPVIARSLGLFKIPDRSRCSSQYLWKNRGWNCYDFQSADTFEEVLLWFWQFSGSIHPSIHLELELNLETFLLWSTLSHTRVFPGTSLTSNNLPYSSLLCLLHPSPVLLY